MHAPERAHIVRILTDNAVTCADFLRLLGNSRLPLIAEGFDTLYEIKKITPTEHSRKQGKTK